MTSPTNHTIDAAGKTLGRVASEAAKFLIGKNLTSFAKNKVPEVSVEVTNAGRLRIDPKKLQNTPYRHYSGYPGGLKEESMKELAIRKGNSELVKIAIKGMLPKNKLQSLRMKLLKVNE